MTTLAWLREYEERVAEWRQLTEAKKTVPAAVLISAPEVLSGNLAELQPGGIETKEVSPASLTGSKLTRQLTATPVHNFAEGTDLPVVTAQKPLVKFAAGQIFPIPKQSKAAQAESGDQMVWFGALVTGAISALVLTFLVSSNNGADIAATTQKFSSANTSQAIMSQANAFETAKSAEGDAAGYRIDIASLKNQFSSENLEEFVKKIAGFINNFNISGW